MSTACISSLLLVFAAQATQGTQPRSDALLTQIPEGLTLEATVEWFNSRGCYRSSSPLAWSPDGARVAYVARRGEDSVPVVGSQVGEPYEWAMGPIFAGTHVFFVVARRLKPSERGTTYHCSVWIDGKTLEAEDMIHSWGVSADGKKVAYWTFPKWSTVSTEAIKPALLAVASETGSGRWFVERDANWFDPGKQPLLFSEDGRLVFTTATPADRGKGVQLRPASAADRTVLIERGKRERWLCQPCPRIDSIAISRTGAVQALVVGTVALDGDAGEVTRPEVTELYFRNKRIGIGYEAITKIAVDPDGKHVACVVASGKGQTVAIDGEKNLTGSYDHVLELAFDAQGERLAFVANKGGKSDGHGWVEGGESFVVVRPVVGDPALQEQAHFMDVRDLVWDPQGEQVACRVRDDSGWRIAYREALSAPHDEVGRPQFSTKELGFGTRDKRELWWRVFRRP